MKYDMDAIERFYRQQCDGLWEHANGISIYTTDNPGWLAELDCKEPASDIEAINDSVRIQFGASVSLQNQKLMIFASSLRDLHMAMAFAIERSYSNLNSIQQHMREAIPSNILQVGDRVQANDSCTRHELRGRYGFIANPPIEIQELTEWKAHVRWEFENGDLLPRYWVVFDEIDRLSICELIQDHIETELTANELHVVT